MAFHIGHYGDVLRTSYFSVERALAGDAPWHYIEDHMGTFIGRLLGTFSGRPRDVILRSGDTLFYFLRFNPFQDLKEGPKEFPINFCSRIHTTVRVLPFLMMFFYFSFKQFTKVKILTQITDRSCIIKSSNL